MYIWFYDVDGDGREEVLPGYELFDGDGNLLWRMEGADYIERRGDHVDHAAFGPIGPRGEPRIGIAGSSAGFFLVDAENGKVLRHHRMGHAQSIQAGNFRPDLPGLEMWVGDRWDNYGLTALYGADGRNLCTFEPDNVPGGGATVNWTGDGRELFLLSRSPRSLGLYDAEGRRVVPFPDDVPQDADIKPSWPYSGHARALDLCGDRRDEILLLHRGVAHIYTQDGPPPDTEKIYAPCRSMDISVPNWETPRA
jgi:hypothetical protein